MFVGLGLCASGVVYVSEAYAVVHSVVRSHRYFFFFNNTGTFFIYTSLFGGSVDGVTRENTLTEDGLGADITEGIIENLRNIFKNRNTQESSLLSRK